MKFDTSGNAYQNSERIDCDICGTGLLPTSTFFNQYYIEICIYDEDRAWRCCCAKCARMALKMAEYEEIKAKKREGRKA